MDRFPRIVALLASLGFLGGGIWAFVDPRGFFDAVASFEPYNKHFLHDIGAFQIGIGAILLLSVTMRDGLYVALAGATIGHLTHLASHVLDRDLGENQTTIISILAAIGVVLVVATVVRARQIRR